MKPCHVELYINPANHALGSKWSYPGAINSHSLTMGKHENSSSLKPQGLELLLAHLSRRLTGELIGYAGIRRPPSVVRRRPSSPQFRRRIFLKLVRPILIKFNVNHNWVGGLMALGFGADCIQIVVSMATDRSHRLTMGKTKKIFFSETTRPTALIFGM